MTETQRLWAPWRTAYLRHSRGAAPKGCVFCVAKRARDDRRVQVVARGRQGFALLNRYPYNVGHLMVAPYRHVGDLVALRPDERTELFEETTRMISVLQRAVHAQGVNLGLNMGRAAGAGIPGHLHMHLVPRWVGDTNFMPVIGKTKVMSQSLDAMYDLLIRTQRR